MVKKFKETSIPEDFSKNLYNQSFLLGPSNTYRIATVLFHGTSAALGSMKNVSVPKAIVFKNLNGSFICAAKVEYITNEDDPTNPSAGRWDYTWTFYEDDIKGADSIEVGSNSMLSNFYTTSGINLYNMKFSGNDMCLLMMVSMAEIIKNWLAENVTDAEEATLVLDGVFKATAAMEDGKVVMGIIPDGEMKVLIKDDSAIQEQ